MGADTIIRILSDSPWLQGGAYRLILQCQSKTPVLRRYLSDIGWRIFQEQVLRDGKFLYTVMEVIWQPDYPRLTPAQTYIPPAMLENASEEVPTYIKWVTEGLRIATAHQDDPEKKQILAELEKIL